MGRRVLEGDDPRLGVTDGLPAALPGSARLTGRPTRLRREPYRGAEVSCAWGR